MRLTTLVLSLGLSLPLLAEHLPGADITYTCLGGDQYQITLRLWRECTGTAIDVQSLDFRSDCGVEFSISNIPILSMEEVSPICPDQADETTCNGGSLTGIQLYTFRTTLFLSACDNWTISWNTCCRYPAVNLLATQGLYVEAILANASGGCTSSPFFSDDQPPYVCVGQPVSYDPGVVSQPGQTLRYHLIDARRQTSTGPIVAEPVFYSAPYTGAEPFTGMVLDTLTGNISFLPTEQGYVVCVIEVSIYNDQGEWIGSVMRDFPFVVQACTNNVPDAASGVVSGVTGAGEAGGDYSITACGGGQVCFDITVADADATQQLDLTSNVDVVLPGASFNVVGTNPAVATVCFNSTGALPGDYNFTVTAVDDACPMPGSQTYTYTLTVAAGSTANAGTDVSTSFCTGSLVDLSTLVNGDPGGTWSDGPVVSVAGTYTYTVTSACGDDEAIFTVTEDAQAADAGADAEAELCAGSTIDLGTLSTGDPGGTWPLGGPIVADGGAYSHVVENACGSDTAWFTITLLSLPNAGTDASAVICMGETIDLWTLVNGDLTGSFGGPSVVSQAGLYMYTVTNQCGSDMAQFVITVNAIAVAGENNSIGYCPGMAAFAMLDSLLGAPQTGGTWTSPDGQAHPPFFSPGVDPTGIYCYTVPGIPPCPDSTACLTITELPPTDPYCIWLGTAEVNASSLTIAPVPSTGHLRIEGLSAICTQVEVLDMQGRKIMAITPNSAGTIQLELPARVADGGYLLRLRTAGGGLSTHRFEVLR